MTTCDCRSHCLGEITGYDNAKKKFLVQPINGNGEKDGSPLAEEDIHVFVLPSENSDFSIATGDSCEDTRRVRLSSYLDCTLSVDLSNLPEKKSAAAATVEPDAAAAAVAATPPEEAAAETPPPEEEEEVSFVINTFKDWALKNDGIVDILVSWADATEDSWEPLTQLVEDCPKGVKKYAADMDDDRLTTIVSKLFEEEKRKQSKKRKKSQKKKQSKRKKSATTAAKKKKNTAAKKNKTKGKGGKKKKKDKNKVKSKTKLKRKKSLDRQTTTSDGSAITVSTQFTVSKVLHSFRQRRGWT